MIEYEVLWNGAHDGVNRDLLCVHVVPIRKVEDVPGSRLPYEPWGTYEQRGELRAKLLALLAERDSWRIGDLSTALGLKNRVIYGVVQGLHRHGLIRTVSHGTIALASPHSRTAD